MENRAGILNAFPWRPTARSPWPGERQVVRSLRVQQVRSRLVRGEQGASLVEYALLLALIALVCVGAIALLGGDVSTRLSGFGGSLGSGT